jgi:hypothetical protein
MYDASAPLLQYQLSLLAHGFDRPIVVTWQEAYVPGNALGTYRPIQIAWFAAPRPPQ